MKTLSHDRVSAYIEQWQKNILHVYKTESEYGQQVLPGAGVLGLIGQFERELVEQHARLVVHGGASGDNQDKELLRLGARCLQLINALQQHEAHKIDLGALLLHAFQLWKIKNIYYAGLSDCFINLSSCEKFGIAKTETGIVIRIMDKINRIKNMYYKKCLGKQEDKWNDEAVLDSCLDIMNYLGLWSAWTNMPE